MTPARLVLLQAIADGAVMQHYSFGDHDYVEWDRGPDPAFWSHGGRRRETVTGRARELRVAGLVRLTRTPIDYAYNDPRLLELMSAGAAVLAEHAKTTP